MTVCDCGHLASNHSDGGFGQCIGEVVIKNPGEPDTIAPCSCENFILWYIESE